MRYKNTYIHAGTINFLLLILLFLITGCATPQTTYDQILNTWLNHNINELVDKWGYPTNSFIAPNGNKVYTYHKESISKTPTISRPLGYSYTVTVGGETEVYYCTTYFEVDSRNIIVKWSYNGNACR